MKSKAFTILFLFFSVCIVKAQNPSSAELAVTAAVEKLRLAMISGHKEHLEAVLSDQLVYGHSNGKIQSKKEFVEAISSRKSDFVKISLQKQSVAIVEKTAIVRHILLADTNDGGNSAHIYLGVVLVWRLEKGSWKLISRSAFHIPPEEAP